MSLEMAQDMGLVPKVNVYEEKYPMKQTFVSNEEYMRQHRAIVDRYCFDKERELVDLDSLKAEGRASL